MPENSHTCLYKHSCHPSKQCKHVQVVTRDAGKRKYQSHHFPQKYRAEQFLNVFASGDVMFCKFCHDNADPEMWRYSKNHLGSNVVSEKRIEFQQKTTGNDYEFHRFLHTTIPRFYFLFIAFHMILMWQHKAMRINHFFLNKKRIKRNQHLVFFPLLLP